MTTRREILKSAPIAIAAVALPSAALAIGDDAELFALDREMANVKAQRDAAWRPQKKAYERYIAAEPAMPEELQIRPDDEGLLGFRPFASSHSARDHHHLPPFTVDRLKKGGFFRSEVTNIRIGTWQRIPAGEPLGELFVDYVMLFKKMPDPVAEARAADLVGAWEAWQGDCAAVASAVDYDPRTYEETTDPYQDRLWEIGHRIFATPARTLDGMQVKLRAYERLDMAEYSDHEAFDSIADDIAALVEQTAGRLA